MKPHLWLISLLLAAAAYLGSAQSGKVRLDDDSDWWSLGRREVDPDPDSVKGIKPQHRQLTEANFRILGVTVGDSPQPRLGRATEVERGDGPSARHQFCYVSAADKTYLIFERIEGEQSAFILFQGGPAWAGSDSCLVASSLSGAVATGSGLRLGLSVHDATKILGEPNTHKPDKLVYYCTFRRKPTSKDRPDVEFVDEEDYIELHFENSRLTYLAVSRSEG